MNNHDRAYVCPGSCQGAVVYPQQCGDIRCDRVGEPLQEAHVVYSCPKSHCENSRVPGFHQADCSLSGELLTGMAVVPRSLQFPILDPPEENRTYSSFWENMVCHAKSTLTSSSRAWCAAVNDSHQWMVMDAGNVVESVGGVVLTTRKDIATQFVTKVAIDAATERDQWVNMVGEDRPQHTNLSKNDSDTFVVIRFPAPVEARFVRIRPVEWENHISLRCAIFLAGKSQEDFMTSEGADEYRDIVDVTQLPAKVPITHVPGGLPLPNGTVRGPRPLGIYTMPTAEWEWEGRRMRWRVLEFNEEETEGRVFCARPGSRCSIKVRVQTRWSFNQSDYCPGCIVQLYYGIEDVFSRGIIEFGIHNSDQESTEAFDAPTTPGLYYITQGITLQYNYVPYNHENSPHWAFAAIRIPPVEFEESTFAVLPEGWKAQFRMLLGFWRRRGDNATLLGRLPRENLYHIFSFLMQLNSQDL